MRSIDFGIAALAVALMAASPAPRANFLQISVTAPQAVTVRAIWRPLAGAMTFQEQQATIMARRAVATPDSLRRWRDSSATDTLVARSPASFVVDMNGGPIVIETTGDSILVEAQLTPARGRLVSAWGKKLVIESDGISPYVTKAPR